MWNYKNSLVACMCMISAAAFSTEVISAPLFGTKEFPSSSFSNLPQWKRVVDEMSKASTGLDSCRRNFSSCDPAFLQQWNALYQTDPGNRIQSKLSYVNKYFNKSRYRFDHDIYGPNEYWATVPEFLKNSGDCEDYAITKYYALKALGVAPEQMRIVAVMDQIRKMGHAILAVMDGDQIYILDNLSDAVVSQARYPHYVPQFSVNETTRWTHFAAAKSN